jgi:hypothetical protein
MEVIEMKLNVVGSNQTELFLNNLIVFFSYNTPVAYYSSLTGNYYVTKKKYSNTTSKHISSWVNKALSSLIVAVDQEEIDKLL